MFASTAAVEAVTAWLGFLDQALVPNRVAQDTAVLRERYTRSGWRPFWKSVPDLCRAEARRPGTVWIYSACRPYFMAHNYAYIGDRDAAVAALEAAYAQRAIHAVFMNADALFKSLNVRSDPRFQDLVRRMNIPN